MAEGLSRWTEDPESVSTERFVAWTIERFGAERLTLTTAFGMEGCVLMDLYAGLGVPLTVTYLDTGYWFPETLALRDRLASRYPQLRFVDRGTDVSVTAQDAAHGTDLWRHDPDQCCALRKVAPLREVLRGTDAWVTSITRHQGTSRRDTPLAAWDWQFQVVKLAPLAQWDRARVREYLRARSIPFNPLHDQGYPTIGCVPCTRPVAGLAIDEYSRAGRWSGTDKTECGLHRPTEPLRRSTP